MTSLIDLFTNTDLMPHGYCLSWGSLLLWLHAVADLMIALAYLCISLGLVYFVNKRKDMPYSWLVLLFSLFIIGCGITHFFDVITLWIPLYWLSAVIKLFTALISMTGAMSLYWVIPLALKIPSLAQLQAEIERGHLIEQARQETLERLQKIASRVPGMVYSYRLNSDGSSCFPYASAAIKTIYGFTPQQVQESAEKVFEILHPDDYQKIVNSILESAKHLTPWQLEYRVIINNTERWLYGNAIPEREQDGATLWHGFITDITEKKLKDIEYQAIIEASTNGFICNDATGKIVAVNNALCQMLGYSQDELLTLHINDIEAIETPEQTAQHIQTIIATGHDNFETKHRRKDGHIIDIAINVIFVKELGNCFYSFSEDISQRKRDEAKLRHSEITFRNTFENAPIGVANISLDGYFLAVNQTYCNTIGYSREELLTMNIMQVAQEKDKVVNQQAMQQLLAGEINCFCIEKQYIRKDNSLVWGSLSVRLNYAPNGLPEYFIATVENIEARKQIEKEIIATRNKLQATINALPDLLFEVDIEGRFYDYHAPDNKLLAVPPEIFLGKTIAELMPVEVTDICLLALKEASQYGRSTNKRYPLIMENELCWFELSITSKPIVDSDEELPRFIVLSRNITESKRAEDALYKSEQLFRNVFEHAPIGIAMVSLDQHYIMANQSYCDILGYSQEELIGKTVEQLSADQDQEKRKQVSEQLLQGELNDFKIEKRYLHKDNSPVWTNLYVSLIKNASDIPDYYLTLIENINERKLAEDALHASNQKFRTLIEKLPLGLALININTGDLVYVNERITLVLGYTLDDINTVQQWWQTVYPDKTYREQTQLLWQAAINDAILNNTDIKPAECRLTCKNGEVRVMIIAGIFFEDTLLVTFTDITQRKQIEETLKASEAFSMGILNSLAPHIAVLNAQGVITMVNHAWQQFADTNALSKQSNYMLACSYLEACDNAIVLNDDTETKEVLSGIQAVMKGQLQRFHAEYPCHSPKEKRWFYMTVSPLQGENRGVVISHENITQRKLTEEALKASETRFRSIIDISPVPLAINNDKGQITFLNPAFIKTFGYELADIPTTEHWWFKAYPQPEYRQWVMTTWQALFKQASIEHKATPSMEVTIQCKNNYQKTVLVSCAEILGAVNEYLVVLYDISERKRAELELRIAATVFESQEGMLITDANNMILRVNQAFTTITGYQAHEVIGHNPRLFRSDKHDKAFYSQLWQSLKETGAWQGEIWNKRKNGEIYPQWLTITAVKSDKDTQAITHYVATITDISERKATEDYINRLAFYDPLTQLPNRRLLQERLKQSIEISQRDEKQMGVLMLDLDRFKAVNDTLGHTAGDELLKQVATRIKKCIRATDMVARLGGDEFIILMDNIGHYKNVARIAEKIINDLSRPFVLYQQHKVYIGVSIGISIYPEHGNNADILRDNADTALYHAKAQGRGCFAYFSEELTQKALERLALESRLRRAIEKNELRVYFQPQLDITTGRIIGAEALVRWFDPIKHCLLPNSFISLAEETGLIVGIGEFVLRETCKIGKQWLNQGLPPITLAVNVSAYQFRRSDINSLITKVLTETDFPARYLELEITESGLMDNQDNAMTILNNLHEQSIRLAIDDFGTGYSSLAYLKYFPVDLLKIDKTFIDDIPFSQGDMTITATIIAMAHLLGFKVLAEGVETAEQLAFLQQQGCDFYQGYLCSPALPAEDFAALLASNARDNN